MADMTYGVIAEDPKEVFGAAEDGPSRWVLLHPGNSTHVLAVSTESYSGRAAAEKAIADASAAGMVFGVIAAGAFNITRGGGELKVIAVGAGN